MFRFPAAYLIVVLCIILVTPAQAGQRAFVASYGNDANNCSPLSPCRSFSHAINVVDPNGEVVVLDSAGYGTVTLTQSISLTAAPGVYAGISVFPGTNGVTIGTPGVNVVLRGLTINSQGGNAGILMTAGAKLSIENCVISNFSISGIADNQHGVLIQTAATVRMVNTLIRDNDIGIQLEAGATADISGSKFLGNSTAGIFAFNETAGTATTAAISNTVVVGSNTGIFARSINATAPSKIEIIRSIVSNSPIGVAALSSTGATATVSIRKSMVTGSNDTGLAQIFDGTMISYGNNTLSNNFNDVGGILTTAAPL